MHPDIDEAHPLPQRVLLKVANLVDPPDDIYKPTPNLGKGHRQPRDLPSTSNAMRKRHKTQHMGKRKGTGTEAKKKKRENKKKAKRLERTTRDNNHTTSKRGERQKKTNTDNENKYRNKTEKALNTKRKRRRENQPEQGSRRRPWSDR